jgi:hypothetical protein
LFKAAAESAIAAAGTSFGVYSNGTMAQRNCSGVVGYLFNGSRASDDEGYLSCRATQGRVTNDAEEKSSVSKSDYRSKPSSRKVSQQPIDEEITDNLKQDLTRRTLGKLYGSGLNTVLFAVLIIGVPGLFIFLATAAKTAMDFLYYLEFASTFSFRLNFYFLRIEFGWSFSVNGPGVEVDYVED